MPRYIDAEKIDFGKAFYGGFARDIRDAANSLISEVPTADVAPVIHAHWKPIKKRMYDCVDRIVTVAFSCSNCGRSNGLRCNYCPRCGAKMDEEVV